METFTQYRIERARDRIRELEAEAAGARLAALANPARLRFAIVRTWLAALVNPGETATPAHAAPVAFAGRAAPDRDAYPKVATGCPPLCDSAGSRAA